MDKELKALKKLLEDTNVTSGSNVLVLEDDLEKEGESPPLEEGLYTAWNEHCEELDDCNQALFEVLHGDPGLRLLGIGLYNAIYEHTGTIMRLRTEFARIVSHAILYTLKEECPHECQ